MFDILCTIVCVFGLIKCTLRFIGYAKLGIKPNAKEAKTLVNPEQKVQRDKYRAGMLIIWLIFIWLNILGYIFIEIPEEFYLGMVCFLAILDMIFYKKYCLLNKIVNKVFHTKIYCCYMCPIRGWDLLMMFSPTLFIVKTAPVYLKVLIILLNVLSALGMYCWEQVKNYIAYNAPMHGECKHECGPEYFVKRKCNRIHVTVLPTVEEV